MAELPRARESTLSRRKRTEGMLVDKTDELYSTFALIGQREYLFYGLFQVDRGRQ